MGWLQTTIFEGINRGIFGIPSAKKFEIESLVKQLESQNPTPDPTLELDKVNFNSIPSLCTGHWHLFRSFSVMFLLLEGGWVLEACL